MPCVASISRWRCAGCSTAFTALTVVAVPPARNAVTCGVIVVGYAGWALALAFWTRRAPTSAVRVVWLTLFVDVAVLTALTLLTGIATPQSWTSDVLTVGFLLIPVLAAMQLQAEVCAAVVVPTVMAYVAAGIATRDANAENRGSPCCCALVAAGVGVGCIGLSRIQGPASDDRWPAAGAGRTSSAS